jgi:hypothetical protein
MCFNICSRTEETGRSNVGLRPDEVNEFFSIYVILPAAQGPGVYSDSNRNDHQKQKNNVLGSRARPVRKADNLTATCEQILYTMLDHQHITTV